MDATMHNNEDIVVLDCTFRDGGYYTGWHFEDALVLDYLNAMQRSRVNVIEAGYLAPVAQNCGRFKVDRLDRFNFLPRFESGRYAVMLDSKAFVALPDWRTRLRESLLPRSDTAIDIIRIAAHYGDLKSIPAMADCIAQLGYRAVLNLMQIDSASDAMIESVFGQVSDIGGIDAVYVADSFGSMRPSRVAHLVSGLRSAGVAAVGFHSHNNMGMALLNSVAAMDAGAAWIDCTVAGMGRGAGNAATEELCTLLDPERQTVLNDLLVKHFSALKQQYGWGENVLYRLAAQRQLHPMYVQSLASEAAGDVEKLADLVYAIPMDKAASFDRGVLEAVRNAN